MTQAKPSFVKSTNLFTGQQLIGCHNAHTHIHTHAYTHKHTDNHTPELIASSSTKHLTQDDERLRYNLLWPRLKLSIEYETFFRKLMASWKGPWPVSLRKWQTLGPSHESCYIHQNSSNGKLFWALSSQLEAEIQGLHFMAWPLVDETSLTNDLVRPKDAGSALGDQQSSGCVMLMWPGGGNISYGWKTVCAVCRLGML